LVSLTIAVRVGPGATATDTKMKPHKMKSHRMKSSKMKSGTATGMSAGSKKGEARNPAGQGSTGTGSEDNAAKTHATITGNLSSGAHTLHARTQAPTRTLFKLNDDHTSIGPQCRVF
jgi:hypothetical protein